MVLDFRGKIAGRAVFEHLDCPPDTIGRIDNFGF